MNKTVIASLLAASTLLTGCVVVAKTHQANFHQQKTLTIQANNLNELVIDAGAGSLKVIGSKDQTNIMVTADIYTDENRPNAFDLSLEKSGIHAELVAKNHNTSGFWKGSSPRIDLLVSLPNGVKLAIDDGSGVIEVTGMNSAIDIKDGSGDIYIDQGRDMLNIEDGSGSVYVKSFDGDSEIEDGSGSIELNNLHGNLVLDDGSGSVNIQQVTGNVTINDGSGELRVEDVSGVVSIDDGSGGITVQNAGGLKITEAGSGSLKFNNIKGKVEVDS